MRKKVTPEKRREYNRRYQEKHALRLKEEERKRYKTDGYRRAARERQLRHYKKNQEAANANGRRIRAAGAEMLFAAVGDFCERCGLNDRRVLQFDHRKGDGYLEPRNSRGGKYFLWLIYKKIGDAAFRQKYAVLCANCHVIKTIENGEQNPRRPKARPPAEVGIGPLFETVK